VEPEDDSNKTYMTTKNFFHLFFPPHQVFHLVVCMQIPKINWFKVAFFLALLGVIATCGISFHAKRYWDAVMLLFVGVAGITLLFYVGFTPLAVAVGYLTLIGMYVLIDLIIILYHSKEYQNFLSREKGRRTFLHEVVLVCAPIFCSFLVALTIIIYRRESNKPVRAGRGSIIERTFTISEDLKKEEDKPLIEDYL